MNEIAYQNHIKKANEAKSLYFTLKELYGDNISDRNMLLFARRDRIVTETDIRLMEDFALIKSN